MFTLGVGKPTETQFRRKDGLIWPRMFSHRFQEKSGKKMSVRFVFASRI